MCCRQLPAEVDFAITTPNPTASSTTVTIEGQGWINVRQIRLSGSEEPLPLQWLDPTHWQVTAPVAVGQQQLTLQAIDFQGVPLGTDTVAVTTVLGDFDASGSVDDSDIDLLCRQVRLGQFDPRFDLNADGMVDGLDFEQLIADVLRTTPGDANLDGIFNSSDLVQVFQTGKYEDGLPLNAGWSAGDWNCDGDFTTTDLVVAFQRGGYVPAATNRQARSANIASAIDAVMAIEDRQDGQRRRLFRSRAYRMFTEPSLGR